jgi:predicted naringenin-chalcone synthase
MSMIIAGIGTALPPHRIAQADASEIAQQYSCETPAQQRLFHAMYRRAGVETRHSVVLNRSDGDLATRQSFFGTVEPTTLDRMRKYEEHAGELALLASSRALEDAGVAAERITHLVTVSCTGFYAPSFDTSVIKGLNLPRGVARTHIGFMGCHGVLNGLRVASAYVEADPAACPLVCAVELCSLHHQYGWNADKVVANALFADGAAAVLGLASKGGDRSAAWKLVSNGSVLIDDSHDAMGWQIGNHGFEMTLSPRVPELICHHLRPWIESWLGVERVSVEGVASWAVHPGGPRILSAVAEALSLPKTALEVSQAVLSEFGNMSSPTIVFILDRLYRAAAPRPCVALAFGPGLAVEAVLLV